MFHHRAPSEPSVDAYVAKFRPSSVNTEPEFSIAIAGICADSRKEAKRLAQQHTNPWVGPNVVGTASDCAALFDRTVRMTGTSEIIFLDLAQDARARLATCHHLAEVCKLTTQA
jgi:alkanesulfonate monooxygenase SsuD/methylene tetrahydromethanopterin reductase-like flavin-dependent oxidoreductase (luciferase family)